jgi:glycosyltransferase involved in cell wall biosynthesis
MKIAYFNYHYDIDGSTRGAAVQIRAIAAGLERRGHEVDLHFRAAKQAGRPENFAGLKRIAWLRRYGHVPRLVLRNLRMAQEEGRILARFRPDVVLAVHFYCTVSALWAARRLGVPVVLFCETPMEYEYSLFHTRYYSYPALGRWIEGVAVRAADQVLCVSEILKAYLVPYGVPATKLHVVPNGVDHRAFCPRPPDKGLTDRLGLRDRLVLGFVGSFHFFSDIPAFLEIVRAVCARHPSVVFLFVGEGEAGRRLRSLAETSGLSGCFVFVGSIPHEEIPRYCSLIDIAISPYRGDYLFYGSSMKLLEYMAAGKPAVVSALGQIKELICDGHNGMLFEPGDDVALRQKLLALIENRDLRTQMGAHARRTVEQGWTWDNQVARIEKILRAAGEAR